MNRLKPDVVSDEPSRLHLEQEYIIDTERKDLVEKGLTDIRGIDVDSRGNVYLIQRPRNVENLVFRFGGQDQLQKTLVRKGSGPGEVQWPVYFGINARDEVQVFDSGPCKLFTFTPSGDLISEVAFPKAQGRTIPLIPLANGKFLCSESPEEPRGEFVEISLNIVDSQFNKIRTLSRFTFISDPERTDRINAYTPMPLLAITPDRIHLGYPGENYEISVYDLEGHLLRKIRKDYHPVPVTEAYRKAVLARAPKGSPVVQRLYFPANKPAFQFLFADETGRLFAMTSRNDPATGQDICDIFDRDGVFIGSTAVGYFDFRGALYEQSALVVVAKSGRMYVLREKENGYKELVVSRAIWR